MRYQRRTRIISNRGTFSRRFGVGDGIDAADNYVPAPVPVTACTVGLRRRGSGVVKTTLHEVILAVRREVQVNDDQKVANIVLYLLETGRVRIARHIDE